MRSYDAAEKILTTLEEHISLSMKMLLHHADVTASQYRAAYNWTLDNFDEPIWIRTWVGREWIYSLPTIAADCKEDWHRTIKTQVTRARREHNKIHMVAKKHPTIDNRLSEELARTRLEQLKIERERLTNA